MLEAGRLVVEGAVPRSATGPRCAAPTWAAGRVTTFFQLVVVGISTGSVFALVGIALVLVYRTTGIVNFAQGVFAVIGGLLSFWFAHTAAAVAMLLAVLVAALIAR